MEYAQSDHPLLAQEAVHRLDDIKDARLHRLAVQLLKEKGLKSFALGLLEKNYRKSDDGLIWAAMKKTSGVAHHVQTGLVSIYTRHRSESAFPILLRAYQKGECAFCREGIVRAMKHCHVLPGRILRECLYDTDQDTQKLAAKVIKAREKAIAKKQEIMDDRG
jgi:hypothetical protein